MLDQEASTVAGCPLTATHFSSPSLISSGLSVSSSEVTLPSESASPALPSDSEFEEESLEDGGSVASAEVADLASVEDEMAEAPLFIRDSARAIFLALIRASFSDF